MQEVDDLLTTLVPKHFTDIEEARAEFSKFLSMRLDATPAELAAEFVVWAKQETSRDTTGDDNTA